jgi:hypothetical protein
MVNVEQGLHGKVILTITDSMGMVVIHETVNPEDVEVISDRVLPTIR